ncbi:MAG: right-handed parallel beta-helix repeat-containing protein [Planctomycetota bacterium]
MARTSPLAAALLVATLCVSVATLSAQDRGITVEQETDGALLLHVAAPRAAEVRGDGTRARPYLHLEDALARLREERAREMRGEVAARRIEVILAPGSYLLAAPLTLGADVQGHDAQTCTVLRGTAPGTRLLGAVAVPRHLRRALEPRDPRRALLPSDAARDAVIAVDLRALGVDPGPIEVRGMGLPSRPAPLEPLWSGRVLQMARWPDDGFAGIGRVVDPGDKDADSGHGATFAFDDARVENWASEQGLMVLAYPCYDWADALVPLAKVDVAAHTLSFGAGHGYGVREGGRFAVLNALCDLHRPGTYRLDLARGELLLWPPANSERGDELLVSVLRDALLHVDGASHVEIEGLDIGATRGVGVRVDGGEDVRLIDCSIRATGSHGAVLRGTRHLVHGCAFGTNGASGVTLEGGDRRTLTPGGHVVEDCLFIGFARLERTYRPGVAIQGVGQIVRHNLFVDAPHCAILFSGNEHRIEDNEIHDVLRECGDCGAIYCGRDWAMHGTVIRHNHIHDLPGSTERYQNAIYLDDMASGITVEGNVVERCNLGMLIGGGRDVKVINNLFVDCKEGIRFDARGTTWMAKDIADPATSTLHQRLREIPFDQEPWASRYPQVKLTLTESFGRPLGSRVVGNAFYRTPFGRVDDKDLVLVENNRSFDRRLVLPSTPDAELDVPEIPGFARIPIGGVGPRR